MHRGADMHRRTRLRATRRRRVVRKCAREQIRQTIGTSDEVSVPTVTRPHRRIHSHRLQAMQLEFVRRYDEAMKIYQALIDDDKTNTVRVFIHKHSSTCEDK